MCRSFPINLFILTFVFLPLLSHLQTLSKLLSTCSSLNNSSSNLFKIFLFNSNFSSKKLSNSLFQFSSPAFSLKTFFISSL